MRRLGLSRNKVKRAFRYGLEPGDKVLFPNKAILRILRLEPTPGSKRYKTKVVVSLNNSYPQGSVVIVLERNLREVKG